MSATLTPKPSLSTPRVVASEAPNPRDTVLVVEDEDSIANLIANILTRGNFRVVRARDSRECLRMLEENETHLALATLDCKLPDGDGGMLCHRIREREAGLPVLFLSGRDVTTLKSAWAGDTRTGFLSKPFLPSEVLKQVRALVGQSEA